ncbi:unnamed protein product [Caenorhabditis auriculariae]|uniref:Prefoldin subunit 4 n=1 Tax=Caenorhabditis auriculariae TaxID=2777116 RepID=A0A8S1H9S8_9PELO|nr:unnamed protein product [Caenorhabditis auriculariae]
MSTPAAPPTVTAADQKLINKFARLYQQHLQLKLDIKEAENQIENINEASDELLLLDTDDAASVPLRIGQCFIHFDSDSITERLEKNKSVAEESLTGMKEKNSKIQEEMDSLKKVLYGKFGDRINLESEREE